MHLPPINLKLTIPTYFEALIMNMMMKIPANLIFKAKTLKKDVFHKFFDFMPINIDLGKNISYKSCSGWKDLSLMSHTFLP